MPAGVRPRLREVVDPAIPPDKRTRRQLCRHHGGIALSVLLQPTFDDLDIGREGLIAICGRDGILRARSALNEKTIGRDMSDTAPFRAAMTTPQGFVRSISPVDGVQRLLSFRSVAGYPLIVVAGSRRLNSSPKAWRCARYVAAAAAATAMLLIEALLVTGQAHVQDRARETAEHANRMKSSTAGAPACRSTRAAIVSVQPVSVTSSTSNSGPSMGGSSGACHDPSSAATRYAEFAAVAGRRCAR